MHILAIQYFLSHCMFHWCAHAYVKRLCFYCFRTSVLDLNAERMAEGIKLHFIDIFLDELTKIGHTEVCYWIEALEHPAYSKFSYHIIYIQFI